MGFGGASAMNVLHCRARLIRGTESLLVLIITRTGLSSIRGVFFAGAGAPQRVLISATCFLEDLGLFGTGRQPVRTARLVWPTAAEPMFGMSRTMNLARVQTGGCSDGPRA